MENTFYITLILSLSVISFFLVYVRSISYYFKHKKVTSNFFGTFVLRKKNSQQCYLGLLILTYFWQKRIFFYFTGQVFLLNYRYFKLRMYLFTRGNIWLDKFLTLCFLFWFWLIQRYPFLICGSNKLQKTFCISFGIIIFSFSICYTKAFPKTLASFR